MSMEKYGVEDPAAQQKNELDRVSRRLSQLDINLTKTASEDEELSRLKIRKSELETELRSQNQ